MLDEVQNPSNSETLICLHHIFLSVEIWRKGKGNKTEKSMNIHFVMYMTKEIPIIVAEK
jgi:hypothetical protein